MVEQFYITFCLQYPWVLKLNIKRDKKCSVQCVNHYLLSYNSLMVALQRLVTILANVNGNITMCARQK